MVTTEIITLRVIPLQIVTTEIITLLVTTRHGMFHAKVIRAIPSTERKGHPTTLSCTISQRHQEEILTNPVLLENNDQYLKSFVILEHLKSTWYC